MSDELEAARRDLSSLRIHREPETRSSRRVWWILGALLLLGGAAAAVLLWVNRESVPLVETAAVRVDGGATGALFSSKGTILPERKSEIASRTFGRVRVIAVAEGQVVKKGDLLAELENGDAKAALKEAEAYRERADRELRRLEALPKESTSEKEIDNARTELKIADARLDAARTQFENTFVRAPFDGMVVKRHVQVGEQVGASGGASVSLMTLIDFASLELVAEVNETNLLKLEKVRRVEVTVEAVPDRKYDGAIRRMPTMADKAKGIVEVPIAIRDKDAHLLPYMTGRATFVGEEKAPASKRVLVPEDALDGDAVWVVEGETVRRAAIRTGASENGFVIVLKGLKGGEQVVLRPRGLVEGQRVRRKEGP